MWPLGLMVIVCDPAEIKRVFTGDPEAVQAGEGNTVTEPVAGPESVLLLDGRRHLHTRKLMLPSFHGERIRVYGELISEITEAEIDRWPVGTPFPIHPSMQTITLSVILRAVFGIEDIERRAELERLIPKLIASPGAALASSPPMTSAAIAPRRRFLALREGGGRDPLRRDRTPRADPALRRARRCPFDAHARPR